MAIKNSVSNDFWSTVVDSINVFDCRLSDVSIQKETYSYVYFPVWANTSIH